MKNKLKFTFDEVVEQVCDNRPPRLPEGQREIFIPHPAHPEFGVRLLTSGVATFTVRKFVHGDKR